MPNDEEEWDMYVPVLPATPPDGWTLENLPPDLPKHTELIRGVLVMSPQQSWHAAVVDYLRALLREQRPADLVVEREMAVRKSARSAPEPDLSVLVERGEDDAPVVHEHRLVGDRFKLERIHIGRLVTDVPFSIDIPLQEPER
jgi:hypothetical protein